MKFLVFTDTHASQKALKMIKKKCSKKNPDVLICCGDFTIFGSKLNKHLKSYTDIGKPLLLIHGNHETEREIKSAVLKFKNVHAIHGKKFRINGVDFYGWGGGGFSLEDSKFEAKSKTWNLSGKSVLITHAPPFNTVIDKITGESCGNKSIKNFIKINKNKLDFAFSGHLHESFDKEEKLGKCRIINPGPYGKVYEL